MQQMAWFSRVRAWPSARTCLKGSGVALLLYANAAYAADMSTILANIRRVVVPLSSLALVISFVIGMAMVFSALVKMKKFGAMQNMMSQPGEIQGPLVTLVVGAMLIYLPSSTDFLMNSLFGDTNSLFGGGGTGGINYAAFGQGASLLSYSGSGGGFGQQWSDLANTLVLFIQFIGFLSFIKGLLLIQKSGTPGHQPGTFPKALTHILGGVVLINFIGAVNIIKNTIFGS